MQELHELSENLLSSVKSLTSMQWQKSRLNWLRERDVNSNIFRSIVMADEQNRKCTVLPK